MPRGFAEQNGAVDFVDRLTGHVVVADDGMILLPPYARLWLT